MTNDTEKPRELAPAKQEIPASDVDSPLAPDKCPSELSKLQFEYAWKWFEYHADQRIKMFNYMILVFGVIVAGIVNALDKHLPALALGGVCYVASFLAIAFFLLDRRNRNLVWKGEDVLIHLERTVIFGRRQNMVGRYKGNFEAGILYRQEQEEKGKGGGLRNAMLGKHRFWLPAIALGLSVLFFAVGTAILIHGPFAANHELTIFHLS